MTEAFLADTYALIEILVGNPNYQHYATAELFTTKMHLTEFYYFLLREYDEKTADTYLVLYSRILIPITLSSIKTAMHLKMRNKKEKLSYTDCIGHARAKELGIPYLTGDEKFEQKENVRFVK